MGQDRFKRRYFILPNGGGIYVEGLESGQFDDVIGVAKTTEQKEQKKEQIDSLLTCIKGTTQGNWIIIGFGKCSLLFTRD